MTSTRRIIEQLRNVTVSEGNLHMEYYPCAKGIEKFFSEDIRKAAFPPDGIAEPNELECYYLLKRDSEIVGYIKAVDLFFDGIIELHGSYGKPTDFLIRSYFALSMKYLRKVCQMFPDKSIKTVIYKNNKKVIRFVNWLGFKAVHKDNRLLTFEIKK